MYVLSHTEHSLSFNILLLISTGKMYMRAPEILYTKMVTRKKPEQKEPLPEELPSSEKITKSVQKKWPRRARAPRVSSPKRARIPAIDNTEVAHRGKKEMQSVPSPSSWKGLNLDHLKSLSHRVMICPA